MSPPSSDASMLAVAVPAPLRPTLLAVDSCTRQHANLLVPGQIVSGLVWACVRVGAGRPGGSAVEASRVWGRGDIYINCTWNYDRPIAKSTIPSGWGCSGPDGDFGASTGVRELFWAARTLGRLVGLCRAWGTLAQDKHLFAAVQ
jgi:hypothetical protein